MRFLTFFILGVNVFYIYGCNHAHVIHGLDYLPRQQSLIIRSYNIVGVNSDGRVCFNVQWCTKCSVMHKMCS